MSGVEALARVLRATTSAHLQGTRPSSWWQRQARAILADPDPLLEALAEAGVLREEHRVLDDGWATMVQRGDRIEATGRPQTRQRRYVTEWRPTDARA